MSEYSKKHYTDNKSRIDAANKKWDKEHKEVRQAISRRYLEKNREKLSASAKVFREKYPQIVSARQEKHRGTLKGRFNATRNGAYRRGLDFSLTIEDVDKLLSGLCQYCGEGSGHIGIDRIENSLGYVIDNVCTCCTLCNMMKKTLAKEQFLSHCRKITNFNKQQE